MMKRLEAAHNLIAKSSEDEAYGEEEEEKTKKS
jgi:hypothetical protein